jgi:ATP-dependent Lon protease
MTDTKTNRNQSNEGQQENPMAKRPSNPGAERPVTTQELPLVALRETVIFPEMIVPLQVGRDKSVAAVNAAVESGGPIALVIPRKAHQ